MLLATILAQCWRPVASNEVLYLLHWGIHAVLYRRTATAIKTASLEVYLLIFIYLTVALAATGAIWIK